MKLVEYKVPEGKLVAAEADVVNGYLTRIKITGDFFMHPESAIKDFEDSLKGIPVSKLEETVTNFFKNNEIQLIGVSPNDFIYVIRLSFAESSN
jgi:lipoate-protein ligase A